MGELKNHSAVVFPLALSFHVLEESGVNAQDHRVCTLSSLDSMLTVKNELLTQGGFNERNPGRSQLYQAVLQSAAGSFFANQHRIIKKKKRMLPHRA